MRTYIAAGCKLALVAVDDVWCTTLDQERKQWGNTLKCQCSATTRCAEEQSDCEPTSCAALIKERNDMKMHYTIRAIPPKVGEQLPSHIDPSRYHFHDKARQEHYDILATDADTKNCKALIPIRRDGLPRDTVRVQVSPLVQKAFNSRDQSWQNRVSFNQVRSRPPGPPPGTPP
jgi:hypothetical protein